MRVDSGDEPAIGRDDHGGAVDRQGQIEAVMDRMAEIGGERQGRRCYRVLWSRISRTISALSENMRPP